MRLFARNLTSWSFCAGSGLKSFPGIARPSATRFRSSSRATVSRLESLAARISSRTLLLLSEGESKNTHWGVTASFLPVAADPQFCRCRPRYLGLGLERRLSSSTRCVGPLEAIPASCGVAVLLGLLVDTSPCARVLVQFCAGVYDCAPPLVF